jgi:hypothetical protein
VIVASHRPPVSPEYPKLNWSVGVTGLLSLSTSFISSGTMVIYIILQLFAISQLLPVLSQGADGQPIFDRAITTWIIGMVVVLSQWIGGFVRSYAPSSQSPHHAHAHAHDSLLGVSIGPRACSVVSHINAWY